MDQQNPAYNHDGVPAPQDIYDAWIASLPANPNSASTTTAAAAPKTTTPPSSIGPLSDCSLVQYVTTRGCTSLSRTDWPSPEPPSQAPSPAGPRPTVHAARSWPGSTPRRSGASFTPYARATRNLPLQPARFKLLRLQRRRVLNLGNAIREGCLKMLLAIVNAGMGLARLEPMRWGRSTFIVIVLDGGLRESLAAARMVVGMRRCGWDEVPYLVSVCSFFSGFLDGLLYAVVSFHYRRGIRSWMGSLLFESPRLKKWYGCHLSGISAKF